MTNPDYKKIAKDARLKVLDMVYRAKSSHIGSNFSVIDILAVLFEKHDKHNDRIVLSAGWKAAAFYYFLARRGDFPMEWLDTYNQEGSKLIGLTEPGVPGVLFAGGSMQMGLPAAVGFALSKKLKGEAGTVYCIMSDGELAGGMIWESILIAQKHKLDNLTVIVDENGLQAMGPLIFNIDGHGMTNFSKMGWKYIYSNGHDYEKLERHIMYRRPAMGGVGSPYWNVPEPGFPYIVFCQTIKGKGVSFMENNNIWHYKDIDEETYNKAKQELS